MTPVAVHADQTVVADTRSFAECRLVLDRSRQTKFEKDLGLHEKTINYEGLYLPKTETMLRRDPQEYPDGEIWRDSIRLQLRFEEPSVDFLTIALVDGPLVYDYNNPGSIGPRFISRKFSTGMYIASSRGLFSFRSIACLAYDQQIFRDQKQLRSRLLLSRCRSYAGP